MNRQELRVLPIAHHFASIFIILMVLQCAHVYAVETAAMGMYSVLINVSKNTNKNYRSSRSTKTLSSTIKYLETKHILLKEIRRTQLNIIVLEKNEVLSNRIGDCASLKRLSEILIARIQEGYKRRADDPVLLFFHRKDLVSL